LAPKVEGSINLCIVSVALIVVIWIGLALAVTFVNDRSE
jgi:hypothetical protein